MIFSLACRIENHYLCIRLTLGATKKLPMKVLYAVKNAFADKYLAEARDDDRRFTPNRQYIFRACNAVYEVALFDTKQEAIMAYEQSFSNQYNETGIIVEMILHEES